ncbi:MAG: tRNA dihydrouridine synthase DusB [Thiotrichales bacterium]|jgi:tRNA-dihydrouridine synthase B|nr:tRNA dihydrouridine synthase DusB [Thiotrichales bacterium]
MCALLRPLQIGPYVLDNNIALAPMAGVSDFPWRDVCRTWGAGYAVGEMLHSRGDLMGTDKSTFRTVQMYEKAPIAIQLLGNNPQDMARAAQAQVAAGAHIIDINMGCPAKKVCAVAAGSALLDNEPLVAAICQAVVQAVPEAVVTLKMRTGALRDHKNAVAIARIAANSGVQLLSVHGRTREDKFLGEAEYDTIAEVVHAVSIPVLANGDITCPEKAQQVLKHTQAAGIMIGRGANGRPWLFSQIAHYLATNQQLPEPDLKTIHQVIHKHVQAMHQFYGDFIGVRMARKHLVWYAPYLRMSLVQRQQLMAAETPEHQLSVLAQLSV